MMKKVIFLIVCIAAIGAFVAVRRMQGSAQGVIKQSPPQTSSAATPSKEKIRSDGKYLSFAYLASYAPVKDAEEMPDKNGKVKPVKPSAFLQSDFLVSYTAISSKKLAVSVERLPSGNFEDNSSFKFRVSSPKRYTQSMIDVNGEKLTLFTGDGDVREQTVFMKHDGLAAAAVLSSSNADLENMKEELLVIVKSIEWKK